MWFLQNMFRELFKICWFAWPIGFVFCFAYGICELLQSNTKEQKKRANYYLSGAAFALLTMVAYFR